MPYENTKVTIESSQQGLRKLLRQHEAEGFAFSEKQIGNRIYIQVEFAHVGHLIRLHAPINVTDEDVTKANQTRRTKVADTRDSLEEAARRQMWRALHWNIKARLESVELGIETLMEAFYGHVVDPVSKETFYEQDIPEIEAGRYAIGGSGRKLLSGVTR